VRIRLERADAVWIALLVVAEIGSCGGYMLVFRATFCSQMPWGLSYDISMAELAADSLLPAGGAGGLALGAWALHGAGMQTSHITRRSVAFFTVTSASRSSPRWHRQHRGSADRGVRPLRGKLHGSHSRGVRLPSVPALHPRRSGRPGVRRASTEANAIATTGARMRSARARSCRATGNELTRRAAPRQSPATVCVSGTRQVRDRLFGAGVLA
jgi:hypothetical protein